MSPSRPRPFPWGLLEATTRERERDARALRAWGGFGGHAALDAFALALGELLGAAVAIAPHPPARAAADLRGTPVAILVGPVDRDEAAATLVALDAALAGALVAKVLRRPEPRAVDPIRPGGTALAGAVAGIAMTAARRQRGVTEGAPGPALRVFAAGDASELARRLEPDGGSRVDVPFTFQLDQQRFAVRARVPAPTAAAAARAAEPPLSWRTLLALGEVPLSLPLVAAVTETTAADLASLAVGDVWLPGAFPPLARAGARGSVAVSTREAFAGQRLLLAAAASDEGVGVELGAGGRLVLGAGVEALPWGTKGEEARVDERSVGKAAGEAGGPGETEADALLEAVGEVPVLVRVEIGSAELRAREWAALAKGDVITLGRPVGAPVSLRVAGVVVATGELVDVDGEVGVRILTRAARGTPGGRAEVGP